MTNRQSASTFVHAPGSNLDYSVDWAAWLAPGEQITDSQWAASDGLTLAGAAIQNSRVALVFASGGVDRRDYVLRNTITTNQGRVDSRVLILQCRVR